MDMKAAQEILLTASVTRKGQVTLPKPLREALHLKDGEDIVGFRVRRERIEVVPVTIDERPWKFTKAEWKKIERWAGESGKVYSDPKAFMRDLRSL